MPAKRHFVIPDTQVKPGVRTDHLYWAGQYVAAKKPDRVIHIGDHWDLPSLSSHNSRKEVEGKRYQKDVEAGNKALALFMEPILIEKERCIREGRVWDCTFDFFRGNHEQRANRAVEDSPHLDGWIKESDLRLDGWRVHPYLQVGVLDGVAYSHFFTSGVKGLPVTSARALLSKKHMSCVMGHVQRYEIDTQYDANGKRLTAIFAGCFYLHDEKYLNPQGNAATWRGVHMLYNVDRGEFTHNNIPMSYLRDRFG